MVKWAWIVVLSAACGSADVKVGEETGALTEAAPHDWQSYRFVERSDDAACTGAENSTAVIEEVVFAQTHAMSPDWPFFFLVGDRPVKVEVSVTGEGGIPRCIDHRRHRRGTARCAVHGWTCGTSVVGGRNGARGTRSLCSHPSVGLDPAWTVGNGSGGGFDCSVLRR